MTQRRVFGALDWKMTSIRSADIYRNDFIGGNNILHDKRRPALFARQGPTSDNQTPFCWSRYEKQMEQNPHQQRALRSDEYLEGEAVEDNIDVEDESNPSILSHAYNWMVGKGRKLNANFAYEMIPPFWRRRRVRQGHFSHYGHPDCFNYTWETFPPGSDKRSDVKNIYVELP